MHCMQRLWLVVGVCAFFALSAVKAEAQTSPLKDPASGDPQVKSIEAINFGPAGLLLIGDGKGKQVIAVDTGDTKATQWTKPEIANVTSEVAGRFGAAAKDIEIKKMAINPASSTVYLAVRLLTTKKDLIVSIDGNGKINEFALDHVKYVAVPLPADQNVTSITGVTWAGDRILVAALAKETFANKCYTIITPLSKDATCRSFTTETYHVAHGRWETNAPIRTMMPYEENGKKFLVGAFLCTPIVKYSLEDMQPGAKVKGMSVVELGQGNTPQYMFTYEKDGKRYILMNTMRMGAMQKSNPVGPSEYWTAKVDFTLLQETQLVNTKALWRTHGRANTSETERAQIVPTFHGVTHMGQLDAGRALVIRKGDNGVNLQVLPLP